MKGSTKERILEAAISLFNEVGVCNTRLQQIADEAGISVGNLAYHFKNKEAIVNHVYEKLFREFGCLLSRYLQQPGLLDFNEQLSHYFAFFRKYRFYLTDLFEIERSFPHLLEQWNSYVNKMIAQIQKRIDFDVARGVLIREPHAGSYSQLAGNIWTTIVFWMPQRMLRGLPVDEPSFKDAVWSLLLPYFTGKGLEEYQHTVVPENTFSSGSDGD